MRIIRWAVMLAACAALTSALAKVHIDPLSRCRTAAGFEADDHFNRDPTEEAITLCASVAESSPLGAAYLARALYRHNRSEEAYFWITRAVAAELPVGHALAGIAYQFGYGVEVDLERATDAYRRAAASGHVNGQHNLSALLLRTKRSEAAWDEIIPAVRSSASRGYAPSVTRMAWLVQRGVTGFPQTATALDLYEQAATQGDRNATHSFAVLSLRTRPHEALERLRTSAEKGSCASRIFLADLHRYGRVVPLDPTAAVRLLSPCVRSSPHARWSFGATVVNGGAPAESVEQARKHLSQANDEMEEDLRGQDPSYWTPDIEPSPKEELFYEVAQAGRRSNTLRVMAAASLRAHEIARRIGPEATAEALADLMSEGHPLSVRDGAAQLAQELGLQVNPTIGRTAGGPPAAVALSDFHKGIRAVSTIAAVPNAKEVPGSTALVRDLKSSEPSISEWAHIRLERLDAVSAEPVIQALLSSRTSRANATLIRLATNRIIKLPLRVYAAGFDSTDYRMRSAAVQAAANNGIALDERTLRRLALDKAADVQRDTLYYGARAGWRFPAPILLNALQSASPHIVDAAIRAATTNPNPQVWHRLAELRGLDRRWAAATSPVTAPSIGDWRSYVLSLPGPSTEAKRTGVLEAVRTLRPLEIAPVLDMMLGSSEEAVRRKALWIIDESASQLHARRVAELALSDHEESVRLAAAGVLLNSWDPGRTSILDALTRDASPGVRALALEGLGMDPSLEVQRAIERSRDDNAAVRYRAARLLKDNGFDATSPVVQPLLSDSDKDVRDVFRVIDADRQADSDVSRWRALPVDQLLDELCLSALTRNRHTLPLLLNIAGERAGPSHRRVRAMHCASYIANAGLSEEQISFVDAIGRDPTSPVGLTHATQTVLEKVINPSAARSVMRHLLMQGSSCRTSPSLANFPERARNEAAREYLLVPSVAVQQYTLDCMGADGTLARLIRQLLERSKTVMTPAEVEALLRPRGSAMAKTLLSLLPMATTSEERLVLLRGLWETMSDEAVAHAIAYRGELPIDGEAFQAWARILSERPSQATLDRLLLELGRASTPWDEPWQAVITLSSRLPDAHLDIQRIVPLARRLSEKVPSWERADSRRVASPIAFLAGCLSFTEDESQRIGADYANNERVRTPSAHAHAIAVVFRQCAEWRQAQGLKYPRTFQAIAKRYLIGADRIDEAIAIGSTPREAALEVPLLAMTQAELAMREGRHADALKMLDQIERYGLPRVSIADGSRDLYLRLAWLRGACASAAGWEDQAVPWLRLAAVAGGRTSTGILATAALIRHRIPPAQSKARWIVDRFDLRAQTGPQVMAAVAAVFEYLIGVDVGGGRVIKKLIDADRLGALRMANVSTTPVSLLETERNSALRQLLELERDFAATESKPEKAVAEARQRLQAWLTDLRMRYPAMVGFLRPQPLQLLELRAALGGERALVQYIVLPSTSYVWVISASTQAVFSVAMGAAEIYAAVAQLRSGIELGTTRSPAYVAAQRTLSEKLIAPVLTATSASHWIVVPHAALHGLPFAALQSGDGAPLIQSVTLSLAPSSSAVVALGTPPPPDANSSLLSIGNASPNEGALALPYAAREAEEVARILPGSSTVKIGGAAVRELLLDTLPNQALHLAIHGEVLPGDRSRLLFADGFVTVRDVWALPLRGSPRVVLSACETGLGEALTGNEVLSLASAFLVAGADSVVSTLWKIRDDSTRTLMRDFYEGLANGLTTAQALAEAQRIALRAKWPPDRWAGFTAHGW